MSVPDSVGADGSGAYACTNCDRNNKFGIRPALRRRNLLLSDLLSTIKLATSMIRRLKDVIKAKQDPLFR